MTKPIDPASSLATPQIDSISVFEILARESADSLTTFLRASVADPATVDDLFQDTMLIAWQKLAEFDRSRPFGAWLRGIAKNLVLAHYRSQARQVVMPADEILNRLDQQMAHIDRQPGDTFDEKIAGLRDCIDRLNPLYQQPVDLHYRQMKTTDWIAQSLSTSRDTIHKRLQRARVQLADCMQRKGLFCDSTTQAGVRS